MIVADYPSLPGCESQGVAESEALENPREEIAGCLEGRRADNMPLTSAVHEIEVAM
jgi:predicted RNase H-like HicB family nuclease